NNNSLKLNHLQQHFNVFATKRDRYRRIGSYFHKHHESFLRFLIPKCQSVLEVGCGTGHTLAALEPQHGVGIDISDAMVEQARKAHPEYTFIHQDAEAIELEDRFDHIVLVNTIGYFEDIQATLQRMGAHLKADGRITLVYFNFLWKP